MRIPRRAVASHSKSDPCNLNAISRFIPDEVRMHHLARKNYKLPCGRTVKESWAALRKAWRGFEIAKSNNDLQRMKHYAGFINKVQNELGIEQTAFDQGLVDIEVLNLQNDSNYNTVEEKVTAIHSSEYQVAEESLPDYDSILCTDLTVSPIPTPRQSIFATYHDRPKAQCGYLPKTEKIIEKHFYPQRSCPSPGSLDAGNANDQKTAYSAMSTDQYGDVRNGKKQKDPLTYAYEQDDQTQHKKVNSERHIYYNKSCATSDEIIESRKARKRRLNSCYFRI
jgi:hypothetical protein